MSQDGADLGISANAGMMFAIAGGQPPKQARRTPNEMREYILGASSDESEWGTDGDGYSNSARYCAKLVLELMGRHPELASVPMDAEYEYDESLPKFEQRWAARKMVREGLNEAINRLEPDFMQKTYDIGLSGFQWGWAVNAARYAMDLPPVRNPAIMTLGE